MLSFFFTSNGGNMIFKEVEYKDNNSKFDWEEVPQEDLWKDGELSSTEVQQKIIHHTFQLGDWILVRRIDNGKA